MAASPPRPVLLLPLILVFADFFPSVASVRAAKPQPICPTSNLVTAVVLAGGSWCPLWIEPSPAPLFVCFAHMDWAKSDFSYSRLEVNGEIIDRVLINGERNSFYSVLFYASWCPFSRNIRPIFDSLASVFPQVQHFVVEEASVMPSILSRYGIHSFPSLILTNGTTRFHYHGSKTKDLPSLVRFYEKTTGLDPINYLVVDETNNQEKMLSKLPAYSLRELMSKEPYMAFSLLFICLKGFCWLFPLLFSHIKAFWASHGRNLNLGFLNESSHMLERVLHGILNKTRNFQKGANNARAWASSLASVSLGESSSSRIANLD